MSSPRSDASTALLAVDTGGTFTDLVLLRDGTVTILKVPSTPDDPSLAVLDGLRTLLPDGETVVLLHGSTVATNALLERRGARVVLLTNAGFEDILEIGRQNRPQLYALVGHRHPPLVRREDRIGVGGRLGPHGTCVVPLDENQLPGLAREVRERGAEAIAITLLHSYADPAHERQVAEAVRETGLPLSISSELVPEFREYERTSTTVMNAYVTPLMDGYLARLAAEPRARRVTIMGSNGGTLPVSRARREPIHTVLSGPAGGVMGALGWGRRAGFDSVASFDMGGTSTDVSLCPGRALRTREFEIGGMPVAIPVLDIHTVGAGGGSLARVDAGGALRVGPESAGARPGPICYGQGGREVTVTDVHLWLGRIPSDAVLGGGISLNRPAIEGPLGLLASGLGASLDDAALGILAVVNSAMERALRVISVERGYDPRSFAVIGFGGAGGLHVAELASRIGASRAIVPPDPGLLSAYGMLASPVTRELSRTVLIPGDREDASENAQEALDELDHLARSQLREEGLDAESLSSEWWIDARYRGQSFELTIPAPDWRSAFHRHHRERYGYDRKDTPVDAVTVRVVVQGPAPHLHVPTLEDATHAPRTVAGTVLTEHGWTEAATVSREELLPGHRLSGPVVVQEYSATTWVPPGFVLEVDPWGSLHISWER